MRLEGDDAETRVVRMPERFRPFRFRDGAALGVWLDAFEVPHLTRLALPG